MFPGPHCTVNGKPSCIVKMPLTCQPPNTRSETPPPFSQRPSLPNGSSHIHDVVQRLRKSKADRPRSSRRSYWLDGVSESPSVVRTPLPSSIDLE